MSEGNIENITKSNIDFLPIFANHHLLPSINFNGSCLINKSNKMLISYTLTPWLRNLNTEFTLFNCLFGSANLTKNADPDKYKYSGYGIEFDSCSEFLFTDGSFGKNVIIFGVYMSSSVHIDNKGK